MRYRQSSSSFNFIAIQTRRLLITSVQVFIITVVRKLSSIYSHCYVSCYDTCSEVGHYVYIRSCRREENEYDFPFGCCVDIYFLIQMRLVTQYSSLNFVNFTRTSFPSYRYIFQSGYLFSLKEI